MKLIIAGSRDITDYDLFLSIIVPYEDMFRQQLSEVVCGMAPGVDLLGKRWAEYWSIPVKEFPANWSVLGNMAGPIRNKEMVAYADAGLFILHKDSKGTLNCIKQAMDKPLKHLFIHYVDAK
jgi:hypothetical protein